MKTCSNCRYYKSYKCYSSDFNRVIELDIANPDISEFNRGVEMEVNIVEPSEFSCRYWE